MTEEQIKEQLSHGFVKLIANRTGFKCSRPENDCGVDMQITRSKVVERAGKRRIVDTGEYVEVQLKSTCQSNVTVTSDSIKYDLEAKTFNDLVDRVESGFLTPLYLILFVLPDNSDDWVKIDTESLILQGKAFWYFPEALTPPTTNTATKRVEIPTSNFVDLTFMSQRFEEVYG